MEYDGRYTKDQGLKCDCLLFDLDDTLYPFNSGIAADIAKNIQDYMVHKLGVEESISLELCILLYKQYGTTMAGLRAVGYQFDYDDFHSFVHGRLSYEKIKPDPVLRNILLSLPIRKVVFTNGDTIHASRALKRLGIEDCFERVVCFETLNPTSPPAPSDKLEIFDIMKHLAHPEPGVELPKSPVFTNGDTIHASRALKRLGIEDCFERVVCFETLNPTSPPAPSDKLEIFDIMKHLAHPEPGVFTNGDTIHASRALKRLGIEDCFERVVCFETLNPTSPPAPSDKLEIFDIMKHLAHPEPGVELPKSPILCKPSREAILQALKVASINPQTTILFDDSFRNIEAAKQTGLQTVLVGTSERKKGADHALESLHNMKEALPELWEEAEKDEDVRNSSKVGIETSVIA